jgi:hypothetical protein
LRIWPVLHSPRFAPIWRARRRFAAVISGRLRPSFSLPCSRIRPLRSQDLVSPGRGSGSASPTRGRGASWPGSIATSCHRPTGPCSRCIWVVAGRLRGSGATALQRLSVSCRWHPTMRRRGTSWGTISITGVPWSGSPMPTPARPRLSPARLRSIRASRRRWSTAALWRWRWATPLAPGRLSRSCSAWTRPPRG